MTVFTYMFLTHVRLHGLICDNISLISLDGPMAKEAKPQFCYDRLSPHMVKIITQHVPIASTAYYQEKPPFHCIIKCQENSTTTYSLEYGINSQSFTSCLVLTDPVH